MGKVINEHKISITLVTAVLCAMVIFKSGLTLGSEQAKLKDKVTSNTQTIKQVVAECKLEKKAQAEFNKKVGNAVLIMQKDIEYLINKDKEK